jgi:putative tryptophan/tyrosine transport system substrate-binding protein
MRRREFIAAVGAAALSGFTARAQQAQTPDGAPSTEQAQGGVRRVGVLIFGSDNDPVAQRRLTDLRKGLEALDWVEGRNLRIDARFGGADLKRIEVYADELIKLAPDVIVTGASPVTRLVEAKTTTIPIVFVEATNATGYGVVGKLAHHQENVTGITNLYLAIGARWVELLHEAAPRITRVALLYNPAFDNRSYVAAVETAASAYKIKMVKLAMGSADDVDRPIRAFAAEPNGGLLMVPPTPPFDTIERVFKAATRYRLPAIYPSRGYANAGGLMAFGTTANLFDDAASYVDKILKGAKPADLPVQFPTRFDLALNVKAAKAIGLEFPKSLLKRAVGVIE